MRFSRLLRALATGASALSFAAALARPAAAQTPDAPEPPPPAIPPAPDFVSARKRMSAADLAKKKEGVFPTGLPFLSSDPLNGFGGGATGYLHFNGRREDPLFAYTPYRARFGIRVEYTTGNAAAVHLKLDVPFIAHTPWRLKVDAKHERAPNNLYFGLTEDTLRALPDGSYDAYAKRLGQARAGGAGESPIVSDKLRNYFLEREWMLNLKAERVLFDGSWRILGGYEIQHLAYETYEGTAVDASGGLPGAPSKVPNGKSLLREDAEAGRAFGLEGGRVSLVQLALMYDTRDFDPDPSRGWFIEWANEHSAKYIGSQFTFHKMLFQVRNFLPILRGTFKRTLLATRLGYGTIFGDRAPFFELQDQWSAEGSVRALGGSQTLRGFKANRFLGRTVAFANFELRHRIGDVSLLGQGFSFTAAPFLDLGGIGDRVMVVAPKVRVAGGAGLRIAWNLSTVIVADAAFSREDRQFFLTFNNSF